MKEDFETGLFLDEAGNKFIKNEFDPERPVFISADEGKWEAIWNGSPITCDWSKINEYPELARVIKAVSIEKLGNENAPTYLAHIDSTFNNLVKIDMDWSKDFSSLTASDWLEVWKSFKPHERSVLRTYYEIMALEELHGAKYEVSIEISGWKARKDLVHLKQVVMWNPTSGSLTSIEWEMIRNYLEMDIPSEDLQSRALRLFCRMAMETLKRPSQILKIKSNGLIEIKGKEGTPSEFFLRIPGVKGQTGVGLKSWQITETLGKDLKSFSQHPVIRAKQQKHDLLFVLPGVRGEPLKWEEFGMVDANTIGNAVREHFKHKSKIVSPRTQKPINLSPYRIRHTGATALALQGFSRQEIQDVLEHDSPMSADAYINAVGSDLFPAIEKASDRGLGKIFTVLSDAYFFKGTITDKTTSAPIIIPSIDITSETTQAPAIVGSCGKEGVCNIHPFWGCYNGCEHFMAWKEFDHSISLDYVDEEFHRWNSAEGGKKRTKLSKDFDKVAAAIREVIRAIDEEGSRA